MSSFKKKKPVFNIKKTFSRPNDTPWMPKMCRFHLCVCAGDHFSIPRKPAANLTIKHNRMIHWYALLPSENSRRLFIKSAQSQPCHQRASQPSGPLVQIRKRSCYLSKKPRIPERQSADFVRSPYHGRIEHRLVGHIASTHHRRCPAAARSGATR